MNTIGLIIIAETRVYSYNSIAITRGNCCLSRVRAYS